MVPSEVSAIVSYFPCVVLDGCVSVGCFVVEFTDFTPSVYEVVTGPIFVVASYIAVVSLIAFSVLSVPSGTAPPVEILSELDAM